VHARRIRPDAGHLDRRRLAAAGLSAVLPGLGQLANGRRQLAWLFLIPSFVLLALVALLLGTQSPARLVAMVANPAILGTLLTLNLVILAWRLVAVGQAYLDTRWHGPTGRLGIIGIVVIALLVVLPHLMVWRYGTALGDTFSKVFAGSALGSTSTIDDVRPDVVPAFDDRINILLVGVDTLPWRTATLTDGLMIVSVDPVGKTVSLLSLPRDLINVPLGNGDVFGPKINSLMSYAERHEDEFPDGGMAALLDAVGALVDLEIPYYARLDFFGFIEIVDAVGGVEVTVDKAFDDPEYVMWGKEKRGWSIEAGTHVLDGENALAYARARKGLGESDFTRAGRQQEILLALRDAVTKDGSLLWELPQLLELVGDTISTNMPVERLPDLAAVVDEIDNESVIRAVIRHPLVKSKSTQYGSSLDPDVKAIQAVAAELFPEPGGDPQPWPTPEPTATPKPSATPEP
jgi:LCP family protein required for cell wall assembly